QAPTVIVTANISTARNFPRIDSPFGAATTNSPRQSLPLKRLQPLPLIRQSLCQTTTAVILLILCDLVKSKLLWIGKWWFSTSSNGAFGPGCGHWRVDLIVQSTQESSIHRNR